MSLNEILSVCVGKGSICIVAIASKIIQSADCIETISFSSKLSSLRIKSDFVHELWHSQKTTHVQEGLF